MTKHIIVTGAAGALGRTVVAELAGAGHDITGIDLADSLEDVAGVSLALGGIDLAATDAVHAAIEQAASHHGAIDGLVNIAGGFAWETIADGTPETWDWLHTMNVTTALNACHAALPYLASPASVVNVGAGAANQATAGMGAYAASKAGVHRLTEALAEELKSKDVRVNAVLPSVIDTPANREDMPDADFSAWVTTGEIAKVIAFLLSSDSSGVTGALIPVPGRV
jgi:NAD(P)-dependent dehydrogenase (short-subunit alcohol dehydrogenase family)